MGRNYIAERSYADPRERAVAKRRKKDAARKKKAQEARSLAAYLERDKYCRNKGCNNLAVGGEKGWWPCCSEACWEKWNASL